jgi:hypothetical protein
VKRVSQFLIRLYPAWWRSRYGGELEALLEDSGSQDVWDLLRGAMEMQMKTWSFGRIVILCGIVGVVVAGAVTYSRPQQYQSTATVKFFHVDPGFLKGVEAGAFTRNAFANTINKFNLYPGERSRMPMEDVIDKVMRREVLITPAPFGLVQVSFAYEDPVQAQRVSQDLADRIIAQNPYSDARIPPYERLIQLVAPADQAKRIGGKVRLARTSLGLPAGLLFGAVLALILRRRAPSPG